MAAGFVHTVHTGAGWISRIEGEPGSVGTAYTSKDMAAAAGRAEARRRRTEHHVHNEDGSITAHSYVGRALDASGWDAALRSR
jgi:hypothetical protein